MKIGNIEIENCLALGPMAGVTDLPFRLLCKEMGCNMLYTEMVSAKAILYKNKNTKVLLNIDKYEHPVWKKYLDAGVKKGHDGMDVLVFSDFIKCVQENSEAVIDVYDMATWMSISVLAEESISMGGQPIAIPDFTSGKWMNRK